MGYAKLKCCTMVIRQICQNIMDITLNSIQWTWANSGHTRRSQQIKITEQWQHGQMKYWKLHHNLWPSTACIVIDYWPNYTNWSAMGGYDNQLWIKCLGHSPIVLIYTIKNTMTSWKRHKNLFVLEQNLFHTLTSLQYNFAVKFPKS